MLLAPNKKNELKIGDQIVVHSMSHYKTVVDAIQYDASTDRVQITLDWGQFGKSTVYGHDEGSSWHRLENFN